MRKSIFLTVLLGLLFAAGAPWSMSTAVAVEPGDTLWTRTYGGVLWDYGYWMEQTTDGGYIIGGDNMSWGAGNYDFFLVKTDSVGDTLWTRVYGGYDWDVGYCVQQTTDGGYIMVGETYSFGGQDADMYVIRTDTNGDTLWTRVYGGEDYDYGSVVQQTTDGGYIIAGYTESWGIDNDAWLLKTDANGDTLWTRTYGGSDWEDAYSVQQTTDGGYIVAGYTWTFAGGDFYLFKTDANGDTLWTRTYGGSADEWASCVQQTTDGGYVVSGATRSFGAGRDDVWLVKTDANGDTLWTRTYGGSDIDYANSVQQTSDGGYILTGHVRSFGAGSFDVYLIKTDANGDSVWTRTYGGSGWDFGSVARQTTDGSYIVAGMTESFGHGGADAYLLKIAGEAPPPDVSIEIIPDAPPVTVPQGGTFGYTGTVTNNTEDPQTTDIWVMASGPEKGIYGPFKEFYDVPLAPSQSHSRHLNQRVANLAPVGFYDYIAYCGDYPSTVVDSSFFQIEVIAGPLTKAGEAGWVLTGSFLEGDLTDVPSEFALLSNYPNPFNASTLIGYQLPVTNSVKLEVYNLLGEKVATLVDGEQEAGYKSVTWEDSEAASGVYFYKLTAGDFTEVKRMTLLR